MHQLGWRNLADRHLTLLFKIIHGHMDISPDTLQLTKPEHRTRANTAINSSFHEPPPENCSNFSPNALSAIPDSNSLPASQSESTSVAAFKLGLARLERLGSHQLNLICVIVLRTAGGYYRLLIQIQIQIQIQNKTCAVVTFWSTARSLSDNTCRCCTCRQYPIFFTNLTTKVSF